MQINSVGSLSLFFFTLWRRKNDISSDSYYISLTWPFHISPFTCIIYFVIQTMRSLIHKYLKPYPSYGVPYTKGNKIEVFNNWVHWIWLELVNLVIMWVHENTQHRSYIDDWKISTYVQVCLCRYICIKCNYSCAEVESIIVMMVEYKNTFFVFKSCTLWTCMGKKNRAQASRSSKMACSGPHLPCSCSSFHDETIHMAMLTCVWIYKPWRELNHVIMKI